MTNKTMAFLTGLPRSGSTLLCAMLNQHPGVVASATSPLPSFVAAYRDKYSSSDAVKSQEYALMNQKNKCAMRGLIEGWSTGGTSEENVYVDKSRGWLEILPVLYKLYDKPRIILTIADLRAIYSSMESLYRKNCLHTAPVNYECPSDGKTIEDRVMSWSLNVPVGSSLTALKECIDTKVLNDVFILKMEDLLISPEETMKKLYSYLGIEDFKYKEPFYNKFTEKDEVLGIPGLHDIHRELLPMKNNYEEILTKSLSDKIYKDYGWYNNAFGYKL